MKIIKFITIMFYFLSSISCTGQRTDAELIKETVKKFWTSVRDNNEEEYMSLTDNNNGDLNLAMLDQLHYLNRNYKKISKKIDEQGIQIKNTNELGSSQKAVEYIFDNPDTDIRPFSVKLFFFEPVVTKLFLM